MSNGLVSFPSHTDSYGDLWVITYQNHISSVHTYWLNAGAEAIDLLF